MYKKSNKNARREEKRALFLSSSSSSSLSLSHTFSRRLLTTRTKLLSLCLSLSLSYLYVRRTQRVRECVRLRVWLFFPSSSSPSVAFKKREILTNRDKP
jgi:hypothetical protein